MRTEKAQLKADLPQNAQDHRRACKFIFNGTTQKPGSAARRRPDPRSSRPDPRSSCTLFTRARLSFEKKKAGQKSLAKPLHQRYQCMGGA